jgi:hypothetical protein
MTSNISNSRNLYARFIVGLRLNRLDLRVWLGAICV